jgi:parallel beta-helix repeat protein
MHIKKPFYGLVVLLVLVSLVTGTAITTGHYTSAQKLRSCIPNVDGNGHSAAVLNPVGVFSGMLNAGGCDFGIYVRAGYSATIIKATIYGAAAGDIVVDGTANISKSRLSQSQVGIYYGDVGASHGTASGNNIFDFSDYGIFVQNTKTRASLTGNLITGTGGTYGIETYGVKSVTISSNKMKGNAIGIYAVSNASATISHNTVTNSSEAGIYVAEVNTVTISHNTVKNDATYGIETYENMSATRSSNKVTNTANGIYAEEDTIDKISHNTVTNTSEEGIYVAEDTTDTISRNTVTNGGTSGIETYQNITDTISNNTVKDSDYGIYAEQDAADSITSNTVINGNEEGIYADPLSGKGYRIMSNVLQNNPTGIEVDKKYNETGSLISANRIGIGTTGILDDGTSDQTRSNFICDYNIPIDTHLATTPIPGTNTINSTCPALL